MPYYKYTAEWSPINILLKLLPLVLGTIALPPNPDLTALLVLLAWPHLDVCFHIIPILIWVLRNPDSLVRFRGVCDGQLIIRVREPGGEKRGVDLGLSTQSERSLDSVGIPIWEALDEWIRVQEDGLHLVQLGFPAECRRMDYDSRFMLVLVGGSPSHIGLLCVLTWAAYHSVPHRLQWGIGETIWTDVKVRYHYIDILPF